ncbi:MAG: thioredoxin domain-containing protein [Thermogutta sp.]
MPNRLIHEKSPYLRQHAHNPVDWFPWGEEALARAARENRPIFLSIGYSACHWCHVMERESFEDAEIAAYLNEHFVCIKVDREELPAVDALYMEAVQVITGRGGWPLSVFLTPELRPFYGGTYWPPRPRDGMPGFLDVLRAVVDAWEKRREQALEQAEKMAVLLTDLSQSIPTTATAGDSAAELAERTLLRGFDASYGGFSPAPKFPHPSVLRFLMLRAKGCGSAQAERMAAVTLDAMAAGGMYDHLGGGFHRYSTDPVWLVPHFEKMLYDNASLARAYLDAYRLFRSPFYARIARETLDYLLRDMRHPGGGFFSSEDADSEGEEGKFYVWDPAEIMEILGPALGERFCRVYDVSPRGNFEGKNILNRLRCLEEGRFTPPPDESENDEELNEARRRLAAARALRVRPGRDEKILLGWNALAVDALCWAGIVLEEERYADAAATGAEFLTSAFAADENRLCRTWSEGLARFPAVLEDYAALCVALISLFETQGDERRIDQAVRWVDVILEAFRDANTGAFFQTAPEHPHVLVRRLDFFDNPTPSGTALTAEALLRLGHLTGESRYLEAADEALQTLSGWMRQSPVGLGHSLYVRQLRELPWTEWVFVVPDSGDASPTCPGGEAANRDRTAETWLRLLHRHYPTPAVTALRRVDPQGRAVGTISPHLQAIFADRIARDGQVTLYRCRGFQCDEPVHGEAAVTAAVDRWAAATS